MVEELEPNKTVAKRSGPNPTHFLCVKEYSHLETEGGSLPVELIPVWLGPSLAPHRPGLDAPDDLLCPPVLPVEDLLGVAESAPHPRLAHVGPQHLESQR